MNELPILALAWLAGALLGAGFFGGLWWTVRKIVSSRHPGAWVFGSMVLRVGAAIAGFFLVSRGDWGRMLACLFGFVMARLVVTWLTLPAKPPERSHAP